MKFFITVFQDENGMFISECPSIPGCVSQGKTEQEAINNIQEVGTLRAMSLLCVLCG